MLPVRSRLDGRDRCFALNSSRREGYFNNETVELSKALGTMTNDPTFEAERLIWRFKKSGAEGVFSMAFLSFPEQVQDAVRQEAAIRDGEVPAILCYLSAAKWALLTNERVVWGVQAQVRSVELIHVADATVESTALLRAGSKQALSSLTLVDSTGTRYQIDLEPGPPFSGFWNAIKAASEG